MSTLGDLKRERYTLWGHCGNNLYCGHARILDLDVLIARFGESHVYINDREIPRRLKSKKCGHLGGTCHNAHPQKKAVETVADAKMAGDRELFWDKGHG